MGELIALLRMAREVRLILVEVGRLIEAGQAEEAGKVAAARAHGLAAGKAAHKASKTAGKAIRRIK